MAESAPSCQEARDESDGRFRPVVVIPVYNHPHAIGALVSRVVSHDLPCILVDDGSAPPCAQVLDDLAHEHAGAVSLIRLSHNQGKGAAVMAGLHEAHRRGHTHALQIDADGQHDTDDIPRFLGQACRAPEALVCGRPIYDASVPRGRLYGRYLTHAWVWINTLSFDIRDSMCGYRVYPLAATMPVVTRQHIGRRMDFDSEIAVRLHWQGVPVVTQPTRVTYPVAGISHFQLVRDNLLISAMHARLFGGMLLRLPRIAGRHLKRALQPRRL